MLVISYTVKPVTASEHGRGYVSLNGVITSICQGKCVDVDIIIKVCRSCRFWDPKKGTPEYVEWKTNHDCSINHTGSSGSMEVNILGHVLKAM